MLTAFLYSLFTHDCVAKHNSNTIIKFADKTTVVGLNTDDDDTAYRKEVRDLAVWCQDNNLYLNVSKTKEMIVAYRKRRAEHAPIHIDGAGVEWVKSFKFLSVHITKYLSRSKHTNTVLRSRQRLFHLRRLEIFAKIFVRICMFYEGSTHPSRSLFSLLLHDKRTVVPSQTKMILNSFTPKP